MTWSAALIDQLKGRHSPVWIIEAFASAEAKAFGDPSMVLTSHDLGVGFVAIDPSSFVFGARSVTPQSWSYQGAAWQFKAIGTSETMPDLVRGLRRGVYLVAKIGFLGWAVEDFEVWELGQVRRAVRGPPNVIAVEAWDMITALRTRLTTTPAQVAYCYDSDNVTTIDAAYTAGDTTLTVGDSSGFDRDDVESGMLRIEPTAGTPFYLNWTALPTGTTITVSATAALDSTAVDAAINSLCYRVAYFGSLHPVRAALKALVSTGTAAANGTHDTLPKDHGFALPVEYVDVDQFTRLEAAIVPASGLWRWEAVLEDQSSDGIGWWQGVLGTLGVWLVTCQGQVSIRCAQDATLASTLVWDPEIVITSADVLFVSDAADASVELQDPETAAEYYLSYVYASGGVVETTTSAYLSAAPVAEAYQVDIGASVFANESNVVLEIANRIAPWALHTPERVTLGLAGAHWGRLAPGDPVRLDIDGLIASGGFSSTLAGYGGRYAKVVSVQADPIAGTAKVSLLVLPLDDADAWGS